jgi:hypothetical protein
LNRRTWRADDVQIARWRQEAAELDAPLETSAQFGFSIFHALARESVRRKLPMTLDY